MTEWLAAACTWASGAVLVVSGALKLGTSQEFRKAITAFQLPRWMWLDLRFARAFPWLEIVLGLGVILLPEPWQLIPMLGVLALFAGFLVLVIRAERRPAPVSCNCFGGLGNETVGTHTIVRNSLLVVLAVVAFTLHRSAAAVAADRVAGWAYPLPAVFALALASALVVWRGVAERRRVAHLVATLTVQDFHGNELPITEFQDPPTFLVFFSSGCGACRSLVQDFRWWPHLVKDGYDLQPVFLGTPEQFESLDAFGPLMEHAWYAPADLARTLRLTGMPGATVINGEHPLGEGAVAGQSAIRNLVLRTDWREAALRQGSGAEENTPGATPPHTGSMS